MEQIWKYELRITDTQKIEMPIGAEILTAQMQDGVPVMWALVNTAVQQKEDRIIEILGTGNPIPNDMGISRKYISTFQRGGFVGHVFERL